MDDAARWQRFLQELEADSAGLAALREPIARLPPRTRRFSARWDQRLTPLRERLFDGLDTAWLGEVGWLEVHWTWLAREAVQQVALRGHLARLETLRLSAGVEWEPEDPTAALQGLSRMMVQLPGLRRLELHGLGWLESHAEALGAALRASPCRSLGLRIEEVRLSGADTVCRLVQRSELSVHTLELEGLLLADQLGSLLSSPGLAGLTALSLDDVRLEVPSTPWPSLSLTSLSLRDVGPAAALLQALHRAGALGGLRQLTLSHLDGDDALLRAIAPALAGLSLDTLRLERLSLYDPEALGTLLEELGGVRHLSLRDNLYDAHLFDAGQLQEVHTLDVRGNDLGPDGARALAALWPDLARVEADAEALAMLQTPGP